MVKKFERKRKSNKLLQQINIRMNKQAMVTLRGMAEHRLNMLLFSLLHPSFLIYKSPMLKRNKHLL